MFFALGRDLPPLPLDLHRLLPERSTITNAGLLYTAKGLAGLLIPLGSLLVAECGNWQVVFLAAAAMNAVAAVLAIAVLRPMRFGLLAKTENPLSEPRRTA